MIYLLSTDGKLSKCVKETEPPIGSRCTSGIVDAILEDIHRIDGVGVVDRVNPAGDEDIVILSNNTVRMRGCGA